MSRIIWAQEKNGTRILPMRQSFWKDKRWQPIGIFICQIRTVQIEWGHMHWEGSITAPTMIPIPNVPQTLMFCGTTTESTPSPISQLHFNLEHRAFIIFPFPSCLLFLLVFLSSVFSTSLLSLWSCTLVLLISFIITPFYLYSVYN